MSVKLCIFCLVWCCTVNYFTWINIKSKKEQCFSRNEMMIIWKNGYMKGAINYRDNKSYNEYKYEKDSLEMFYKN